MALFLGPANLGVDFIVAPIGRVFKGVQVGLGLIVFVRDIIQLQPDETDLIAMGAAQPPVGDSNLLDSISSRKPTGAN